MRVNRYSLYLWFGVLCLLAISASYFYFLVQRALEAYSDETPFGHIANIHDHLVYSRVELDVVIETRLNLSVINVYGIGLLFYFMGIYFGLDFYDFLPLVINLVLVCFAALFHKKVIDCLGCSKVYYLLFLVNLPLIYYSQLIGKDVFATLILYVLLFLYLKKSYILLLIISVLGSVIRIQMPLHGLFLLFFSTRRLKYQYKLIISYTVASLIGAYMLNYSSAIGAGADIGQGLTHLLYMLNQTLPIGNLLLNPVRLFQHIFLVLFFPLFSLVSLHPYGIMCIPLSILFFLRVRYFFQFLTSESKLNSFGVTLILVVLMQPMINPRYFYVILPFLLIALMLPKRTLATNAGAN